MDSLVNLPLSGSRPVPLGRDQRVRRKAIRLLFVLLHFGVNDLIAQVLCRVVHHERPLVPVQQDVADFVEKREPELIASSCTGESAPRGPLVTQPFGAAADARLRQRRDQDHRDAGLAQMLWSGSMIVSARSRVSRRKPSREERSCSSSKSATSSPLATISASRTHAAMASCRVLNTRVWRYATAELVQTVSQLRRSHAEKPQHGIDIGSALRQRRIAGLLISLRGKILAQSAHSQRLLTAWPCFGLIVAALQVQPQPRWYARRRSRTRGRWPA